MPSPHLIIPPVPVVMVAPTITILMLPVVVALIVGTAMMDCYTASPTVVSVGVMKTTFMIYPWHHCQNMMSLITITTMDIIFILIIVVVVVVVLHW